MVIAAVNQRDVQGVTSQSPGASQASESTTNDDNVRAHDLLLNSVMLLDIENDRTVSQGSPPNVTPNEIALIEGRERHAVESESLAHVITIPSYDPFLATEVQCGVVVSNINPLSHRMSRANGQRHFENELFSDSRDPIDPYLLWVKPTSGACP
jgi:hypothetical protein